MRIDKRWLNQSSILIARHSVRCAALCAMLFALCVSAEAEQQKKLARLGYLTATSRSVNPGRVEAFRQGLRELGYIEAKNIAIEWRFAEGKPERLPGLAAELMSSCRAGRPRPGPPKRRQARF